MKFMGEVLEKFVEGAPVAVMARLGLERAISAEWVDQVFEQNRRLQYTRELLFSDVVDLMSTVAMGMRPSLHAAAQKRGDLSVSMGSLFDKVNHTEPSVIRGLAKGSGERLTPVVSELRQDAKAQMPGYRIRIVDGNHLPASEKRLAPLRGFKGAALPGFSLVVYDPDLDLVVDLLPCEDAHAQERALLSTLFAAALPGELWIGDRNFCTSGAIETLASRFATFLFREHGRNPNPTPAGDRQEAGRIETGVVYEQPVDVENADGNKRRIRRIELVLDMPTEDGDTIIRLLTNLPDEVDALTIARLYRRRWSVEGLFGRLEAALNSEIRTLGRPRAALLAFATAVVAYNVLAVIQSAIAATHDLGAAGIELSTYYVADDVKAYYAGMMLALPSTAWIDMASQEPAALAATLRQIAAHVDPSKLRKHPRRPKLKKPKGYAPRAEAQRHVATARVLRAGAIV